jgi:hypothetical protein
VNSFKAIKDRIKYHLILQSVSDILEKIGITITPYYTFEEYFSDKLNQGLNPESSLAPLEGGFLSSSEIEQLCLQPEHWDLATEKAQLLDGSARCFALKHNGEIVVYEVCNLRECDSRLTTFPLKEDEVYLSGMYTFPTYRGKNLASVIEFELYKQLYSMGLKKYHSINVVYNAPSLKFKEKLKSRPTRLRLFIKLFNKFQWNLTLKTYHK